MGGPNVISRRCWRRPAVFTTSVIFLVVSVSALILFTKPGWLRGSEDSTFTPEDEPGVGFDLTASYGFAFHFCNSCTAHMHSAGPQQFDIKMGQTTLIFTW